MWLKNNKMLYFITDSSYGDREYFFSVLEKALKAGVDIVQLREKNIGSRDLLALAKQVKIMTDSFNVPLIIDDRLDIALLSGAGVHLGQEDIPVDEARKILPRDRIIGATVKTVEAAKNAKQMGADYLGVGAIFPTKTKVKTQLTSVATLKQIVAEADLPTFAIGGLNQHNLDVLNEVDITGVCVVSAIMGSAEPELAVAEIKSALNRLI